MNLSDETLSQIGTLYELQRLKEIWTPKESQQMFTLRIIGPCPESLQTILDLLLWKDGATSFGVQRAPERATPHGWKQAWTLIAKTPEQNGGVDTRVKRMLLLMNFEERSTFHTFSAGPIDTLFVWNVKEVRSPALSETFGSPPISPLRSGILN